MIWAVVFFLILSQFLNCVLALDFGTFSTHDPNACFANNQEE